MGLYSNGAINGIRALGERFPGLGRTLGTDVATNLLEGRYGKQSVIGGAYNWIMSGENVGQKIARGGALYMGMSAAGRVASGGGLYRDRSGRFNVIGVPFI